MKTKRKVMLSDLVGLYIESRNAERAVNRQMAPRTQQNYHEAVRLFSRFLGRPATVADLTAAQLNKYLEHSFVNDKSEYTVKSRRTLFGGPLAVRESVRPGAAVERCEGCQA
jgi:hypothetical protein